MVAALLRIPSDILRACRDTDVLLGPGPPPGRGHQPLPAGPWWKETAGGLQRGGRVPHRQLLALSRLCPRPRASCSHCPARLGRLSGHLRLPERTRRAAHPRGADPNPTVAPTPSCPGFPGSPARWAALRTPSHKPRRESPRPADPAPGQRRRQEGAGSHVRSRRTAGGPRCARTGPATFQGRRGPGRAAEIPLPMTCPVPGGDTARPGSRVEPCRQGPSPPENGPAAPTVPGAGRGGGSVGPEPSAATYGNAPRRDRPPREPPAAAPGGTGPSGRRRPRPRCRGSPSPTPAVPRPLTVRRLPGPPRPCRAPPRRSRSASASARTRRKWRQRRGSGGMAEPAGSDGAARPRWSRRARRARDGRGGRAPAAAPQRERRGRGWGAGRPARPAGVLPVCPGDSGRGISRSRVGRRTGGSWAGAERVGPAGDTRGLPGRLRPA